MRVIALGKSGIYNTLYVVFSLFCSYALLRERESKLREKQLACCSHTEDVKKRIHIKNVITRKISRQIRLLSFKKDQVFCY